MKVQLLQDVKRGNQLRVDKKQGQKAIVWEAGTIIEASEATGQKFIERGIAKAVDGKTVKS